MIIKHTSLLKYSKNSNYRFTCPISRMRLMKFAHLFSFLNFTNILLFIKRKHATKNYSECLMYFSLLCMATQEKYLTTIEVYLIKIKLRDYQDNFAD